MKERKKSRPADGDDVPPFLFSLQPIRSIAQPVQFLRMERAVLSTLFLSTASFALLQSSEYDDTHRE
jgi:hypothetical protein